jgi:hypothetical protein
VAIIVSRGRNRKKEKKMSGAMRLFKMPAEFATRNNYPIIRDTEASAGRSADRVAARTDTRDETAVSPRDEQVVTTQFQSLLGGRTRDVTA